MRPFVSEAGALKNAVEIARQITGVVADPDVPAGILEQTCDPAVGQSFGIAGIENLEPCAVKLRDAVVGTRPDVAAARLQQRGDGVLWNAILGGPGFQGKLAGRIGFARGGQAHCTGGQQKEK